jgi:hypothetical protein
MTSADTIFEEALTLRLSENEGNLLEFAQIERKGKDHPVAPLADLRKSSREYHGPKKPEKMRRLR